MWEKKVNVDDMKMSPISLHRETRDEDQHRTTEEGEEGRRRSDLVRVVVGGERGRRIKSTLVTGGSTQRSRRRISTLEDGAIEEDRRSCYHVRESVIRGERGWRRMLLSVLGRIQEVNHERVGDNKGVRI